MTLNERIESDDAAGGGAHSSPRTRQDQRRGLESLDDHTQRTQQVSATLGYSGKRRKSFPTLVRVALPAPGPLAGRAHDDVY